MEAIELMLTQCWVGSNLKGYCELSCMGGKLRMRVVVYLIGAVIAEEFFECSDIRLRTSVMITCAARIVIHDASVGKLRCDVRILKSSSVKTNQRTLGERSIKSVSQDTVCRQENMVTMPGSGSLLPKLVFMLRPVNVGLKLSLGDDLEQLKGCMFPWTDSILILMTPRSHDFKAG